MATAVNWWGKRFGVERACTCKRGHRHGECTTRGYHLVDSHDDMGSALTDARKMTEQVGVSYRVVDQTSGKVI